MKITDELIVTEMALDGFRLSIPEGFSELLNRSGAWKYKKQEDDSSNQDDLLKSYERKVVLEEGKLRTYLTYNKFSVKHSGRYKNKEVNNLTFFSN